MILEAGDSCNTLSFTWTSGPAVARTWNILVTQIGCNDHWKPPSGCLQYFTGVSSKGRNIMIACYLQGTTGYISSYNWAGGVHLADQNYNNCVRAELGHCSISYAGVGSTGFQVIT